jgi:hypothetical protein
VAFLYGFYAASEDEVFSEFRAVLVREVGNGEKLGWDSLRCGSLS